MDRRRPRLSPLTTNVTIVRPHASVLHLDLDAFFAASTWLGSIAVLLLAFLALAWRLRRRGDALAFRCGDDYARQRGRKP